MAQFDVILTLGRVFVNKCVRVEKEEMEADKILDGDVLNQAATIYSYGKPLIERL